MEKAFQGKGRQVQGARGGMAHGSTAGGARGLQHGVRSDGPRKARGRGCLPFILYDGKSGARGGKAGKRPDLIYYF